MAKYYVQSGNVSTIISADDAEKAALWVVHRTMQQILPVYDEAQPEPALEKLTQQGGGRLGELGGLARSTPEMMVLGAQIQISEEGFDREDCESLDTFRLVCQWNQLMVALDRLQELL